MRSSDGEALPVAMQLQGGGHPNAAGAALPKSVQRVADAVEYLKKALNPIDQRRESGRSQHRGALRERGDLIRNGAEADFFADFFG